MCLSLNKEALAALFVLPDVNHSIKPVEREALALCKVIRVDLGLQNLSSRRPGESSKGSASTESFYRYFKNRGGLVKSSP